MKKQFIPSTYQVGPALSIDHCEQTILTRKLGYAEFSSGNFAVKDISLGYVSVSRDFSDMKYMNETSS